MKTPGTDYKILVINPGSTSTKLAIFHQSSMLASAAIDHSVEELTIFSSVAGQLRFRLAIVRSFLEKNGVEALDAIAARGGLLRPVRSGCYRIGPAMISDLEQARYGEHASNLGALCAAPLADVYRCGAFIADPVVVDEMDPVAKISGIPEISRRSLFHALNQKSAARETAERIGKRYEECNFIVAHLGGGISVGAHRHGRVIDVNNALDGDGPFSPERSGGVPAGDLLRLRDAPNATTELVMKKIVGRGGLSAYCGTNDLREVKRKIAGGDESAALVFRAMAYRIGKEIAMHGATLEGDIDAIIITGGLANDRELTDELSRRVAFLAPLFILPGEREMESLARAAFRVLNGEEKAREYP